MIGFGRQVFAVVAMNASTVSSKLGAVYAAWPLMSHEYKSMSH